MPKTMIPPRPPATEPSEFQRTSALLPLRGHPDQVQSAEAVRLEFLRVLEAETEGFLRQVMRKPYDVQGQMILGRQEYVCTILAVADAAWWLARRHEDPTTGRWLTCPGCDRRLSCAEFRLALRAGCCSACDREGRAAA